MSDLKARITHLEKSRMKHFEAAQSQHTKLQQSEAECRALRSEVKKLRDIQKNMKRQQDEVEAIQSSLREISDTVLSTNKTQIFDTVSEATEEDKSQSIRELPKQRGSTLATKARSGYRDSIALLYGKDSIDSLHNA